MIMPQITAFKKVDVNKAEHPAKCISMGGFDL